MARTSTRRWKGCAMCKYYKFAGYGDATRMPWSAVRKMGKKRRLSRHDVSEY